MPILFGIAAVIIYILLKKEKPKSSLPKTDAEWQEFYKQASKFPAEWEENNRQWRFEKRMKEELEMNEISGTVEKNQGSKWVLPWKIKIRK